MKRLVLLLAAFGLGCRSDSEAVGPDNSQPQPITGSWQSAPLGINASVLTLDLTANDTVVSGSGTFLLTSSTADLVVTGFVDSQDSVDLVMDAPTQLSHDVFMRGHLEGTRIFAHIFGAGFTGDAIVMRKRE